MKLPFRIVDGFIRRIWGKFGIDRIAMWLNGVFVVRFRNLEGKKLDMEAVQYSMIKASNYEGVVCWFGFNDSWSGSNTGYIPWSSAQIFEENVFEQIAILIGKPIRSDRATAQKDLLEYARVLIDIG